MRIRMDYDRRGLEVEVPDLNLLQVLNMRPSRPVEDPSEAVARSLQEPIGSPPLHELARGRDTACVVVSDITRPVPNKVLLPPVLGVLEAAGIPRDKILILIATGLHRPNEGTELADMLGHGLVRRYRVENHAARDADMHEFLGTSPRGIPAHVDRRYLQADLKITTGMLEPHLMAGYSGGRKSVCPGVCAVETVRRWHGPAILDSPRAIQGVLEGNPVHEESLAIARMAGVDFIVNVVLNDARAIIGVFSGDLERAFERGVEFIEGVVVVPMREPADIVLTSCAGYPLDTTWYQSIKGLVGALPAVKEGGTIILAVGLREGVGSEDFQRLLSETGSLEAFMRRLKDPDFFAIDQWQLQEHARVARNAHVMVYSDGLSSDELAAACVEPVPSVEEGIRRALQRRGSDASIAVIPKGPYVIPRVPVQ